jgi:uncharacterized protein YndB with AHSA1/START domain
MANDRFVYVTYIRTTPEKLWDALREPEFTRAYWFGNWQESGWKKGASWKLMAPDGSMNASGEIAEIEKPKRLIISWRGEKTPEQKAEGYSRCTYDIEPAGNGTVKLSVMHEIDRPNSIVIRAVSGGWPMVLSNLKSFLEVGDKLPVSDWMGSCARREAEEAAHA